ncbi:MAG: FtsW/RodA/SpoVE family cell cycle protein [Lachnospira sp.]
MLKKYKFRSYNIRLVVLLVITCVYALSIVNSANSDYTMKQGFGMLLSFVLMLIISLIDYNWILKFSWLMYAAGVVMLLMVKVAGHSSHGAERWIKIGGIPIQPSEFVKLILILFAAKIIAQNKEKINSIRFLALLAVLLLIPVVLVVIEPDLSTTILICLILVTIIFASGLSYKIIGIAIAVIVPLAAGFLIYIVSTPEPVIIAKYQRDRIVTFLSGDDADEDDKFQQEKSVQAIGSGQLTGKGLNNNDPSSLKNNNYIPEAQNDFIFAVIGEELGFVGCVLTIFLLFSIVFECIITAIKAKNFEGRLICCGVAAYIAFQSFINIGVVTRLLPNTGIPLPFFSCGLTSLVTLFSAMGIIINIGLKRTADEDDFMFADDFRG